MSLTWPQLGYDNLDTHKLVLDKNCSHLTAMIQMRKMVLQMRMAQTGTV